MPKCESDYQCPSNQKCCPNKCNSNSCTTPSAVNTGYDGGYKSSNKGKSFRIVLLRKIELSMALKKYMYI